MQVPVLDFEPTMPNAIRRATELYGSNDFVVMPGATMSFAEADIASQRVAAEMLTRGIGKGTRIGFQFSYGFDWIVVFYAAARIGALCLPMSTAYRPAELHKAVVHGDVDTLIVPRQLHGADHVEYVERAFPSLAEQTSDGPMFLAEAPLLRSVWMTDPTDVSWAAPIDLSFGPTAGPLDPRIDDQFLRSVEAQVTPADWLMIIHTSGTTGNPKGVIHSHGAFIRHNENLGSFTGVTADSTQFSGLPWFWIGGVVLSVGHSLAKGFKILCLEKFDESDALDLIIEERPHLVGMWGQLAQRFSQYVASTGRDVSEVPAFARAPGAPTDIGLYHNSLGQTESLGPHSAAGPEGKRVLPEGLRGSFGLPVPHVEHRIIDSTGEDLPPGVEGDIIVRGYSISVGLYKLERHEALDDDGWLHTGDRGYFKQGYLFFTGRSTEMIKTLGSNVAPREVELVLEAVPEVGLAIVVGLDDDERGQVVAAMLVPVPGAVIDVDAVRLHATDQLSSYKVPRHFLVIEHEELPALGSGKPNKRQIFEMLVRNREQSTDEVAPVV